MICKWVTAKTTRSEVATSWKSIKRPLEYPSKKIYGTELILSWLKQYWCFAVSSYIPATMTCDTAGTLALQKQLGCCTLVWLMQLQGTGTHSDDMVTLKPVISMGQTYTPQFNTTECNKINTWLSEVNDMHPSYAWLINEIRFVQHTSEWRKVTNEINELVWHASIQVVPLDARS